MKTKLFSIILILFLLSKNLSAYSNNNIGKTVANYSASAQKSILTGKVTNKKTGQAMEGATVYLHEAKTGAITDHQGIFVSHDIPSGKYLVEVSFQGFSTIIETIHIQGNTERNFELSETFAEHEEVTVTGVASATRTKQTPQTISIVKKSELLQSSGTNIIDAISRVVPGVSNLGTGPAISKPVIRGLGYNRVLTVHDGIRQEGQQWGDEHGIEVDEYSIQKVEVLKGPASLFYGSDAMAGVVHLISNVPVQKGTINGNLFGTMNGNSGLYGTNANITGHLSNGFNWNAYGSYKSAGDYRNAYDGKVFNSRFNEKNFGGYLGINKSWGYSHILISNFNQQIGMIEGARDANSGQFLVFPETADEHIATMSELDSRSLFTPFQQVAHFKIASDNNFALGTGRIAMNIGFQKNQRKEFGNYLQTDQPDLFFNLQTINYSLNYHFQENNGWLNSIGITGMSQQNRNLADELLIPAYNQFDIGAFFYAKKSFDKISFSGGLRADYRSLTGLESYEGGVLKYTGFTKQFSNLSGSLGISYAHNKSTTWKFNLSRGYRAPSVSELASNGAHEGTDRYEYGDLNLQTETSFQFDAGVEVDKEHMSFAVSAFYNSISNYIFYSKLESMNGGDSIVNLGGSDLTAFKFRQSGAALYGLEARLDIHPHPLDWLHFENNFSMVSAHFSQRFEGSNKLPFIPAPRLLSVLRANFNKKHAIWRNSYLKIELDNMATQNSIFTAYNTETVTPGYSLLNLGAGTDIMCKGKIFCSIHFALNNLTDVAYQSHLSRLKYTDENLATGRMGVFNMGRNFSLKLNIPLQFKLNS